MNTFTCLIGLSTIPGMCIMNPNPKVTRDYCLQQFRENYSFDENIFKLVIFYDLKKGV